MGSALREGTSHRYDLVGIGLSLGCAAHCVAVPLLISLGPLVRDWGWMTAPWFHQLMALLCCGVIVLTLMPNSQRRFVPRIAAVMAAGVTLLVLAAFVLPDPCCAPAGEAAAGGIGPWLQPATGRWWLGERGFRGLLLVQPLLTPLGGALVATAHLMNLDQRRCGCSEC